MSAYLGHLDDGSPLLHITNGIDSQNILKTDVPLDRTVFHSNESYVKITEVGVGYSYRYNNNNTRYSISYIVENPILPDNVPNGAKVFGFGIYLNYKDGKNYIVGTHENGVYYWHELNFDRASRLATDAEGGLTGPSGPVNYGKVTFFAVTVINNTIDDNDIKVGSEKFSIGNFEVSKHSYLSRGRVNTIDTFFNIYKLDIFQILNSQKSKDKYSGFELKGASLGFSYDGVSYPIFSSEYKNAAIIRRRSGNDVYLESNGASFSADDSISIPNTRIVISPPKTYSVRLPNHSVNGSFFLVFTVKGTMLCVRYGALIQYNTIYNLYDGTPVGFINYNPSTHVVDGIQEGTTIQYIEVG